MLIGEVSQHGQGYRAVEQLGVGEQMLRGAYAGLPLCVCKWPCGDGWQMTGHRVHRFIYDRLRCCLAAAEATGFDEAGSSASFLRIRHPDTVIASTMLRFGAAESGHPVGLAARRPVEPFMS